MENNIFMPKFQTMPLNHIALCSPLKIGDNFKWPPNPYKSTNFSAILYKWAQYNDKEGL